MTSVSAFLALNFTYWIRQGTLWRIFLDNVKLGVSHQEKDTLRVSQKTVLRHGMAQLRSAYSIQVALF
jgi:hypothetical protein